MRQKMINAITFFFILVTLASMFSLYLPKSLAQEDDTLVIPNEAIRLRILANSNSEQDQEIKRMVRDRVNAQITEWVSELTSIEEARETIVSNLDELEAIAKDVLAENGVNQSVQIRFGEVDFPTKLYGNFLYPAGVYEAVLITLGEGEGANWWCVLFPPLCFLDFSNGTAVSEGFEDEEQARVAESDVKNEEVKSEVAHANSEQTDSSEINSQISEQESEQTGDKAENIYVEENEDEVEVKFFLVELVENIFDLFK